MKSQTFPVDVTVLRGLQGVMSNFGATRGLLVSWGGFKSSAISEAQKHYFQVRLWDSDQLLRAIFEHYERLPEDIQAELPLKRVWPWSGQWRIE